MPRYEWEAWFEFAAPGTADQLEKQRLCDLYVMRWTVIARVCSCIDAFPSYRPS